MPLTHCLRCPEYNPQCKSCQMFGRAGRSKPGNDYIGSATAHMYAANAVKFGDVPLSLIERMVDNPDFSREVLARIRRESRGYNGRIGVAATAAAGEPMLIANKKAIEKSLKQSDTATSKHAKDKVIKTIRVKADSTKAARIAGSWATHDWKVYSLKYGPGLVLVKHDGEESSVFPGYGKLRATLEEAGFKIIR